ncbi:MAG TPA: glycosyltransferase N-terminal domain-containing protein [bacterium]|nr:glycosyltransferase N-terminal domain-containing protein [bacterium]
MSAAFALYRVLTATVGALGLPALVLRGRDEERRERCGESPAGGVPAPLWIHAASLGETAAAGNFLREVRKSRGPRIALSATTRTGKARAETLAPECGPFFLPLDAPQFVKRSLDRVQPASFVTLETELWPVLLHELIRRGIPWGMASARLSRKSARRYALVHGAMREFLGGAAAIGARTASDAQRFLDLGAHPSRVRVTGDLKEGREVPPYEPPPGGGFRWIAACTRPGEEEIVLEAAQLVAKRRPGAQTWIAPRHAERFEEVAGRIAKSGMPWIRWSERGAQPHGAGSDRAAAAPSILLIDQMGVLDEAYRQSSCAFIGGSLAPFGGHNPLEAAALGRAILLGPHTENIAGAADALVQGGGARRVTSAGELADEVTALAADAALRERRGRAAREFVARAPNAAQATIEFLRERGVIP